MHDGDIDEVGYSEARAELAMIQMTWGKTEDGVAMLRTICTAINHV